jgi:GST-like protein
VSHRKQRIDLDEFPHAQRWFLAMKARPAVIRAYEMAKQINTTPVVTDASRSILFGQGKQPSR